MNSTLKSLVFWLALVVVGFGIYSIVDSRSAMGGGAEQGPAQVAGEWHLGGQAQQACAIFRQGGVLLMVNERGDVATGKFEDGKVVVLKGEGWERGLTGEIREAGKVLAWRDGSVWTRP